jgi:hypothetical protein
VAWLPGIFGSSFCSAFRGQLIEAERPVGKPSNLLRFGSNAGE